MTAPALSCTRGDSPAWTLTLAQDATGWAPRWTCKPMAGWADLPDTAASIACTVGSGLTVTQSSPGIIVLSLTAAQTGALTPGVYAWDLQMTSGSSVETVEWDAQGTTVGTLTVSADVTRTTP